jgi:hypothetical protein
MKYLSCGEKCSALCSLVDVLLLLVSRTPDLRLLTQEPCRLENIRQMVHFVQSGIETRQSVRLNIGSLHYNLYRHSLSEEEGI